MLKRTAGYDAEAESVMAAAGLKVDEDVRRVALTIFHATGAGSRLKDSIKPSSVLAGAFYIACMLQNVRRNQHEVARAFDMAPATVMNAYRIVHRWMAENDPNRMAA